MLGTVDWKEIFIEIMAVFRRYFFPKKIRCLHVFIILSLASSCYFFYMAGVFEYPFQIPFFFYSYPLDIDLRQVVNNIKNEKPAGVQPINGYRFGRILTNDKKCTGNTVFLLLVIKSAVNHFVRRAFIRKTWGKEREVLNRRIATIFIIGEHPGDHNLQRDIRKEHEHFQDIVQDAYVDNYWNNTIKMMQGFHWAIDNCRNAKYLAFVDDDYYVNPENLVRYLEGTGQLRIVSGFIWDKAVPLRYKWSKWYTPLSEYPYWFFPPYPAGGAFALTMESAVDLTIGMHYCKYIRFDDVFLGMVAWKLGIVMNHNDSFYVVKVPYSKSAYRDLIACHGYDDSNEMMDVWRLENPNSARR